MAEKIIAVAWITEAMKARTHNYYHADCYPGTNFPNQIVRQIEMCAVSIRATCCECWRPVREGQEVKR